MNDNYASLSRRFAAQILDGMILFLPCLAGNSVLPVVGGLIVWFFYAPILEASELRATLGKHLMGIQVADMDGGRISLRAAFIRNLLKLVSSLLLFLGFIVALFTPKKQTLHDLIADTTVVYGRSDLPVFETWLATIKALFPSDVGLSDPPPPPASSSSSSSSTASPLTQLERLQVLREKGTLTEDEFQLEKRKILERGL